MVKERGLREVGTKRSRVNSSTPTAPINNDNVKSIVPI